MSGTGPVFRLDAASLSSIRLYDPALPSSTPVCLDWVPGAQHCSFPLVPMHWNQSEDPGAAPLHAGINLGDLAPSFPGPPHQDRMLGSSITVAWPFMLGFGTQASVQGPGLPMGPEIWQCGISATALPPPNLWLHVVEPDRLGDLKQQTLSGSWSVGWALPPHSISWIRREGGRKEERE